MVVRSVGKIKVIGKRGTGEPFKIPKHKGEYLYIPAKDVEKLVKINSEYKFIGRGGGKVKPLKHVKIVGRGGVLGFKPFLVAGERYLCIPAEDLERLWAVNEAYGELLRKRRAKRK